MRKHFDNDFGHGYDVILEPLILGERDWEYRA